MKRRIFDISVFASLFICMLMCVSFEDSCKGIRSSVFRLHVIAHSDSEADQELKLRVRDAILEKSEDIFSKDDNLFTVQEKIEKNIPLFTKAAQDTISSLGYTYSVRVEKGKSFFPTRQYESITLPAGHYNALRVIIGEGEGKNWWCVMFPPMCLPAAADKKEMLNSILDRNQMQIVTEKDKYEVRFWIIEKYQQLISGIKDNTDS